MGEPADGLHFSPEAANGLVIAGPATGQHLHSDHPIEFRMPGLVDPAHDAVAQFFRISYSPKVCGRGPATGCGPKPGPRRPGRPVRPNRARRRRRPQAADERVLGIFQREDRRLAVGARVQMAGQFVRLFFGKHADGILAKRFPAWATGSGHGKKLPAKNVRRNRREKHGPSNRKNSDTLTALMIAPGPQHWNSMHPPANMGATVHRGLSRFSREGDRSMFSAQRLFAKRVCTPKMDQSPVTV